MHAIELTDEEVDPRDKDRFTQQVAQVGLDIASEEVLQCYERLRVLYQSNFLQDDDEEYDYEGVLEGRGSPTGVVTPDRTPSKTKKRKRVMEGEGGRLLTENGEEIAHFEPV